MSGRIDGWPGKLLVEGRRCSGAARCGQASSRIRFPFAVICPLRCSRRVLCSWLAWCASRRWMLFWHTILPCPWSAKVWMEVVMGVILPRWSRNTKVNSACFHHERRSVGAEYYSALARLRCAPASAVGPGAGGGNARFGNGWDRAGPILKR